METLAGVGIAGAAATFSYLIGLGFTQRPGTEIFLFVATFSGVAGCAFGRTVKIRARPLILVNLVFGFAAAIIYNVLLDVGLSAGTASFIVYALLVMVAFFCFGFMLPLAGISLGADAHGRPDDKAGTTKHGS